MKHVNVLPIQKIKLKKKFAWGWGDKGYRERRKDTDHTYSVVSKRALLPESITVMIEVGRRGKGMKTEWPEFTSMQFCF